MDELTDDRVRRDALLWNFTVLGEAASQVSDAVVQRYSEVPWRQPILLRNRIVHGYWSIDLGILLATATNQLPDFVTRAPSRPRRPRRREPRRLAICKYRCGQTAATGAIQYFIQ